MLELDVYKAAVRGEFVSRLAPQEHGLWSPPRMGPKPEPILTASDLRDKGILQKLGDLL